VIAEAARIKIYSSRTFFSLALYCSSTLYNLKLEVGLESFANSYSVPTLAHDKDRDKSETYAHVIGLISFRMTYRVEFQ